MKMIARNFMILTAALSLAGCASMNVFKDSSAEPPAASMAQPDLPPVEPTTLSAAQIKSLLNGKSWRWTGSKFTGVTLYASDGTSLVEISGKGTTGGKWTTKDGQLCESFAPLPGILPQGVPMTCQPFSGSAGTYKAGSATFTLAS